VPRSDRAEAPPAAAEPAEKVDGAVQPEPEPEPGDAATEPAAADPDAATTAATATATAAGEAGVDDGTAAGEAGADDATAAGEAGAEPGPRAPLPVIPAAAIAALSGTVMVTSFPPYGLWWLAPVAVALLAVAVRGQRARRGAWLGALHGAAFFAPLLHWTGLYVGSMPWLLLAGLQTVFLALLGAAAAGSGRFVARVPWSAALVTAVLWVGQEALRSRLPWGGFPWGRLAFSQDESPLLRLASLGGAPLVTFAVALAGGLLAAALDRPWRRVEPYRWLRPAGMLAAAVAVVFAGLAVPVKNPDGRTVTVAVIQGNVPRLGLDFNAQRRQVLENHVNATLALAGRVAGGQAQQPDLVVWPENSSDIDPLVDAEAGTMISGAAAAINAPILVGAVLEGPGRFVTNAGIVWDPQDGSGARYVKRHPVPFAEYVPLRGVARMVTDKVDLVRRDFKGGDEVGTLKLGPATIGDVICFEVAYDALVRDTVVDDAQLLVVQTNNATFGMSPESAQQLAMVRLRAVEHGRPAVMASTSGVSATVNAQGRVIDESKLFTEATFVRAMTLGEHRTIATTLGGWPEALLALAGLAALLAAAWLRYRGAGPGHSTVGESVETMSERRESDGVKQADVHKIKEDA
jgi:apolipoprotein N-acyltransferase